MPWPESVGRIGAEDRDDGSAILGGTRHGQPGAAPCYGVGSVVAITRRLVIITPATDVDAVSGLPRSACCLSARIRFPASSDVERARGAGRGPTPWSRRQAPDPGRGPHPAKRANPVGTPPATPGLKARRPPEHRWRSGGADGNEILTSAAAIVLVVLLVAEWITVVHMNGLIPTHMFIGLVLIPPSR